MQLSEFIEKNWVCCGRTAENRTEALKDIFSQLPDSIRNDAREQLITNDQELPESTFSVGHGVAFPHARTSAVEGIKTAIGLFPDGVRYRENGSRNVQLIVLFLFEEKRSGLYLKTLSAFSKLLEQEVHIDNLSRCSSPESLISYIEATGSPILGSFSLHDLVMPPKIVLRKTDTVDDALNALTNESASPVPVVDDEGILQGQITHSNLIELCLRDYCGSITVGEKQDFADVFADVSTLHGDRSAEVIMDASTFTIPDSSSLFEATYKIVQSGHSQAFVTADERLVGRFCLSNWTDKIARLNS